MRILAPEPHPVTIQFTPEEASNLLGLCVFFAPYRVDEELRNFADDLYASLEPYVKTEPLR